MGCTNQPRRILGIGYTDQVYLKNQLVDIGYKAAVRSLLPPGT